MNDVRIVDVSCVTFTSLSSVTLLRYDVVRYLQHTYT